MTPAFLDRAGLWFLCSGIQEPGGGVARYYRSDLQKNQAVSTEITGYAASALVWLGAQTGDPPYLEAARRAARFLIAEAWSAPLATFPFELARNGAPSPPAYFFDIGIIVRGLLAVWRATGEPEFLDAARDGGRAMRDFLGEGAIHPILSLPDKLPLPYGESWSRRPGCYQLKSAMAWHDLGEEFAGYYETALARALTPEEPFLPGAAEREKVMDRLHAYCYFLEGLLPVAARPECRRALADGVAQAAHWLREIAPRFARSDVYAQLLRIRLLAGAAGVVPLDARAAQEEAEALTAFQLADKDPRLDGGFSFGRKNGELMPFVNPVSTAFSMQALAMWEQRHTLGRHDLI